MRKVAFYTLGCRLNQTETAIMAKGLEDAGYRISEDLTDADLCVINTCTVTHQADAKCRKKIRSVRRANPNAVIAVVGCFPQVSRQQVLALEGVDLVLGNAEKLDLARYVDQLTRSPQPLVKISPLSQKPFSIRVSGQSQRTTRANLKVQDGCDFVCSFCIIPTARGRSRPRQPEDIRREVQVLATKGIKEIVLTGVNIGTYDYQGMGLADILEIFETTPGIERVRISSIEPTTVDPRLLEAMKSPASKLVPHLHLPLQSAANPILEKMRRHYTFEEYRDFVRQAAADIPDLCIGSDVMTGFPGESESLFEETRSALAELPLAYFHVFPFAERQGTTAARRQSEFIRGDEIARRAAILRRLSQENRQRYMNRFVGRTLEVLFESKKEGKEWQGLSPNYIRVAVPSPVALKNQIRPVRIQTIQPYLALGVIVS